MPTLWIPTDDPWKFRHLPFQIEKDDFDMGRWSKREFIKSMREWPLILPKELSSKGQRDFVNLQKTFYKGLSVWLEAYELGKGERIMDLLFHPLLKHWKPHADLSVATLNFCRQIHPRLERAQQVSSFESLWGMCEFSNSLLCLRPGWITGQPETNEEGWIQGKTNCLCDSNRTIKIYKQILKTKEPYQGELITDFDPNEHLIDLLVWEAINFVVDEADEDLEHHCKQYLDALLHYNEFMKDNKEYQIPYLPSLDGELRFTEKGKQTSKPKGFVPDRPRGRPIGSRNRKNVKNY